MVGLFKLARIDTKYCDYLREYDSKVAYNKNRKELRPFVGVLFTINDCEYFAPLSSPKLKHLKMHNTKDFVKLDNGNLGAINFNNMIPVAENNYVVVDLNEKKFNISDQKYQKLLKEQLSWLNENYIQIRRKASNLYNLYKNNKLPLNIKNRCCNFILLEEKCLEYNKETMSV